MFFHMPESYFAEQLLTIKSVESVFCSDESFFFLVIDYHQRDQFFGVKTEGVCELWETANVEVARDHDSIGVGVEGDHVVHPIQERLVEFFSGSVQDEDQAEVSFALDTLGLEVILGGELWDIGQEPAILFPDFFQVLLELVEDEFALERQLFDRDICSGFEEKGGVRDEGH